MRKVSIVVTTHNRSAALKITLDGLRGQVLDGSFSCEVIIVDNNSTDDTKAIVESYTGKGDASQLETISEFHYCFEPMQGKGYALNHGIREAEGEIIAFTDDDVMVDPHWVMNILKCFKEKDCDGLGGRVIPVYPENAPQWIKKNPTKLAGVVVIADYGEKTMPYVSKEHSLLGANCAFKREVFDDCGFFRLDLGPGTSTMGEDTEFNNRLAGMGKSIYYCGEALVRHPVDLERLRLKYIVKWHTALGRFAAHNEIIDGGHNFVYYFGVPRYLIKGVVQDFFLLLVSIFNRPLLFDRTRMFFRKVGMIQEYRKAGERDHG